MTIKELINEHKCDNIELIVWKWANNHKRTNIGLPHFDYYNHYGIIDDSPILTLKDDEIRIEDGGRIDLNQEVDYHKVDYYEIDQQRYFEWDDCPGINLEDEPESTVLITIDPDCIEYI